MDRRPHQPSAKAPLSPRAKRYNPACDEPAETLEFASLWELLRRNTDFQKDAEVWLRAWEHRERLLPDWKAMSEGQRESARGKRHHRKLVHFSNQLFAIKFGSLPWCSWKPVPLDQPGGFDDERSPSTAQLDAAQAWERADYIHCALSWLLPTVERHKPVRADHRRQRVGHAGRPEEYRPELTPQELSENQPFGPLRLDTAWPQTPPGFRRRFIHAATPGWKGDKVELLDLNELAIRLIEIGNVIPMADSIHPRPSPEELERAKDALYAIAIGQLGMLHARFKAFIIPAGVVYSRSQFVQVIKEIEKHFKVFNDGRFPKAGFLGRANQWEAFLIAESLPRIQGRFDYHETARQIAANRDASSPQDVKSRVASRNESDVKDRCNAILHWIQCVYPCFRPRPFVSRKGRKTVPESS